jgi:hypothetical protein
MKWTWMHRERCGSYGTLGCGGPQRVRRQNAYATLRANFQDGLGRASATDPRTGYEFLQPIDNELMNNG